MTRPDEQTGRYGDVRDDIDHIVVDRGRIAERVDGIADEIASCYPSGRELTIVAVLTGSLIFLADLIRCLPIRMRLDVVSVSSYPGDATEARELQWRLPITADLKGRDVLIVDDVLDTGQTLRALLSSVRSHRPASVRSCVLLRKPAPGPEERPVPDFVGFDIASEFVVGYGLDFDHLYRNLPEISVLARHARRPAE